MNVRSLKLAGAAAGLLLLVGAAPNAYAQTIDVFGGIGGPNSQALVSRWTNGPSPSTTSYTFNTSMILNSVGFYTNGDSYTSLAYSINGVNQVFSMSALSLDNGMAWLDLASPLTMQANDVVRISTLGRYYSGSRIYETIVTGYQTFNTNANVTIIDGEMGKDDFDQTSFGRTNGNLRVSPSNPSSNVAPEPGSIALLLTGGGALAGIALRRRRNAG
jgi:hypothetical protein